MDGNSFVIVDSDEESSNNAIEKQKTSEQNGEESVSQNGDRSNEAQQNQDPNEDQPRFRGLNSRILRLDPTSRFLEDFNPEFSVRERRKMYRKNYSNIGGPSKSNQIYDERGILRDLGLDLCDCLEVECPGCHFPCPNCKSSKCGQICRCNRKWMYEAIEFDGKDVNLKNKFMK